MTNKQTINKNIKTVFDFVREIIDNPELSEQLPDKFDMDDQKDVIDSIGKNNRNKSNGKNQLYKNRNNGHQSEIHKLLKFKLL